MTPLRLSLSTRFSRSLSLCFHVAKVRIYFGPCKQNAKKPVFFGGIFHPIFAKKIPAEPHFFHFSSFLSFLTPHSSALRDGGREHGPLRAGKFPAPCAGCLSYMLHYLSLLMPSAGATIWLQCVTKPTFSDPPKLNNLTT